MSHEKLFHRVPKTSKDVVHRLQSYLDRSKPKHTLEVPTLSRSQTVFTEGFASSDVDHDIQYEPRTVRLQEQVYAPSVTFKEDPRLKQD